MFLDTIEIFENEIFHKMWKNCGKLLPTLVCDSGKVENLVDKMWKSGKLLHQLWKTMWITCGI